MEVFDPNPWRQQLAQAVNCLPGLFTQFTHLRWIAPGGNWIEDLHPQTCHQVDQALAQLGFRRLQALTCKAMPGWVLRGFSHPDQDAWAVHYLGLLCGSQLDFCTEFVDGGWITTTTHAFAVSMSKHKRIRCIRGLSLNETWEHHCQAVRDRGVEPMVAGDGRELAESIWRYMGGSF